MKEKIEAFLNGTDAEIAFDSACPDNMLNALETLGCILEDDYDTNGWQWDWWQSFTYKDAKFVAEGSGYYGTGKITRGGKDE